MHKRVDAQKGWFLFLFAILVASFFGGAFGVVFSGDKVREVVQERLAPLEKNYEVSFDFAEVSLADELLPQVGLRIVNLSLKERSCGGRQLYIHQVNIPIHLRSSLGGDFRLRRWKASQVDLMLADKSECEKNKPEPTLDDVLVGDPSPKKVGVARHELPQKLTRGLEKLKILLEKDWARELRRFHRWVPRLNIARFNVYEAGVQMQSLSLKDFELDIRSAADAVAQVDFDMEVDTNAWSSEPLGDVRVESEWSPEKVTLSVQAPWREGRLSLAANYDVNGELSSVFEIKNLPAPILFEALLKAGYVADKVEPRFMWMNCQASISTKSLSFLERPVELSSCSLAGEAGGLSVEKLQLLPWSPEKFRPFQLKVSQLDLKKTAEAFGREGPSGILNKFGRINGVVTAKSPKAFLFSGHLEDLEFYFSNQGQRGQQPMQGAALEFEVDEKFIRGELKQVVLEEGQFEGGVSFQTDRRFRDGVMQVKVDRLEFHPSIQRLMVGGEMGPIAIFGRGELAQGEFASWEGEAGLPFIKTKNWSADKIKFKLKYQAEQLELIARLSHLSLTKDFYWQASLRPLYLENEKLPEDLEYNALYLRAQVRRHEGEWLRFRAESPLQKAVFSSTGRWQGQEVVEGEINVDFPDLKLLSWELKGLWVAPQILPSSDMLKRLAKKEARPLDPKVITEADKLDFIKDIVAKQKASPLEKIRTGLLETAKKLIPKKNAEDKKQVEPPQKKEATE